ncbi:Bromodomain-containing protein [Marasmius fiardii PR-910]|nr:Bromodomain-containing protein [Marasmius fiardii PR-910]
MGKRELAALGIGTGAPDVEGPRSRRKLDHAPSSSDVEMDNAETAGEEGRSTEEVRVQGLKLWQTVKDATKDGRSLTTQFLKQPHRRTYPDYYVLITHPIALEDIKKKLDIRSYPSLEAVRQDLELCFTNAKAYNRKDSEIYQDAKDLLKLTNKTFNKMMPSEEEGEGKHKPPSLSRLIKSRLQKLIDKADDDGRSIAYEFLELPSRKDWPIYYKEIKKPQCLNNIMKRIKHKEYANSSQFAEDVELVFANALHFNQEGTIIWEDARSLRDYFRTLMADIPPPFDLPQYSRPTNKIKIKMPAVQPSTASAQPPATSTSTTLRLPAPLAAKVENKIHVTKIEEQEPVPTPIPPPTLPIAPNNAIKVPKDPPTPAQPPAPTSKAVQKPAPAALPKLTQPAPASKPIHAPKPVTPVPPPLATPTPAPAAQPFLQLRPSPTPAPPPVPPSAKPKPPPKVATPPVVPIAPIAPSTPATPPAPQHRLKCVKFRTEPRGRWINLDHRDGVASWAMRLDKSEQSLYFHEVTFFEEEDEDSGGEEENEEEDVDMEADTSPKQVKKKRGRGRPKATRSVTKSAAKASPAQKKKPSRGETQVKLNGNIVNRKTEDSSRWTVDLVIGLNTLEVGEKGGVIWKIYAERMG